MGLGEFILCFLMGVDSCVFEIPHRLRFEHFAGVVEAGACDQAALDT
jgi:hypothetical protein